MLLKHLTCYSAGLEEPNEAGAQVDNMEAGGFFARFGRERNGPRATIIPPAAAAPSPVPVPPTGDDSDGSDDSDS